MRRHLQYLNEEESTQAREVFTKTSLIVSCLPSPVLSFFVYKFSCIVQADLFTSMYLQATPKRFQFPSDFSQSSFVLEFLNGKHCCQNYWR